MRPSRVVASIGIVGPGRVGRAAAMAFRSAGYRVAGPSGRGESVGRADVLLLCVPDREIAAAADAVRGSADFVGHTSGATPIGEVGVDFGLHPLRAFVGTEGADAFRGIGCAVAGTTPEALAVADELVAAVGGEPFPVADAQRAGYHAAASIASNFLVTLEAAAETMAAASGSRHPTFAGISLRWSAAPSRTGPRTVRARRSPDPSPAETSRRCSASALPSRPAHLSCSRCSMRCARAPARWRPPGRPHHEDRAEHRRCACRRPRRACGGRPGGTGADDGGVPRRASFADPASPRRERPGGRVAVRESDAVRCERRPGRLSER